MANATREALLKIDTILTEAEWGRTEKSTPSPDRVAQLRHTYKSLLRPDHVDILEDVLRRGKTVEEAGGERGLSPRESEKLLSEAIERLQDFALVSAQE